MADSRLIHMKELKNPKYYCLLHEILPIVLRLVRGLKSVSNVALNAYGCGS